MAPDPRICQEKGFALIVALSLMSMILLLIVSLSTLVHVETLSSVDSMRLQIARRNAVFGLQTAIGQLQTAAGPDQRITATAGILDNDSATDDAYDGVEHPWWTGVWNSQEVLDTTTPQNKAGSALTWLISGNQSLSAAPVYDPLSAIPADIRVMLVGQETVGNDEDLWVYAPKVKIEMDGNPYDNYFAYWVSDESVKTKVNAQEPDELIGVPRTAAGNPNPEYLHRLQTPQREGFTQNANTGWAALGLQAHDLSRLQSQQQLGLLMDGQQHLSKEAFHSVTTWGNGLLVNVRDGGLKQDLTRFFEDGDQPATDDSPALLTTTALMTDTDGNAVGESQFGVLRSWAQAGGGLIGYAPVVRIQPQTATQQGFSPVITEMINWWSLSLYEDGVDSKGYSILRERLHWYPAVTLWNPYNVTLTTGGEALLLEIDLALKFRPFFNYKTVEDGNEVELTNQGGQEIITYEVFDNAPIRFRIEPFSLAPGEAKVFYPATCAAYPLPAPDPSSGVYTSYPTLSNIYTGEDYITIDTGRSSLIKTTLPLDQAGIKAQMLFLRGSNPDRPKYSGRHRGILYSPDYEILTDAGLANFTPEGGSSTNIQNKATKEEMKPLNIVESGYYDSTTGDPLWSNSKIFTGITSILAGSDNMLSGQITKWVANYNVRARDIRQTPVEESVQTGNKMDHPTWIGRTVRGSASYDEDLSKYYISTDINSANETLGYTAFYEDNKGQGMEYAFFDVPREDTPPLSIGALQHAQVSPYNWHPSYAIGNSLADPRVARTHIVEDVDEELYDVSYLVNKTLWDRFFLSGIASAGTIDGLADGTPSPNRRLNILDKNLATVTADDLRDFNDAAAHLWVNGAFNVNSTDPKAWAGLLLAFRDLDPPNAAGEDATAASTPYARLLYARQGAINVASEGAGSPGALNGFRALSDDEIGELAEAIVRQVKLRGPFQSMGDFVNRRLENTDQGLMGALQAAIENTSINRTFYANESYVRTEDDSEGLVDGFHIEHATGATDMFVPGYLSQADLLSALGQTMTVRGDTFIIRSFGEVTTLDGQTATALCEAVVQRMPEQLDNTSVYAATDTNGFGRRFRIVAFKWLPQE